MTHYKSTGLEALDTRVPDAPVSFDSEMGARPRTSLNFKSSDAPLHVGHVGHVQITREKSIETPLSRKKWGKPPQPFTLKAAQPN